MNPQTRNDILVEVFDNITQSEEYYLGFKYNPIAQIGSCNCTTTNFLRFPLFKVTHKGNKSIIYFKSHHGDTTRVSVASGDNFYDDALEKIKGNLQQYAGDWNDSDTNPFHPDYNN